MPQQIIALGGGGFSDMPEDLALNRYLIGQTGKSTPRVCFLGQAGGEALDYLTGFYFGYGRLGCRTTHVSLFGCPVVDLAQVLLEQDLIYVGGGNTKSMLALWRVWGVDDILRRALAQGTVLAGVSAGANCWFEQGITDSVVAELSVLPCLGFLSGSFCPHYDGEATRRPAFHRFLVQDEIAPGLAAENWVGIHFVDGVLAEAVAGHHGARAYRLWRDGAAVVEEPLATVDLSVA
jgi:peptidase E